MKTSMAATALLLALASACGQADDAQGVDWSPFVTNGKAAEVSGDTTAARGYA